MRIFFIRHGMTKGNLEKRYIGITDEALCQDGIRQLKEKREIYQMIPNDAVVWASPMKRCLQTVKILWNDDIQKKEGFKTQLDLQINSGLRECNFGAWEGKNYLDLIHDQDYQQWIDSGGILPFPKGESVEQFKERCVQAFLEIWNYEKERKTKNLVLVVHGGTIMAILERLGYPKKGYYDYQCKNGSGYCCRAEEDAEKQVVLWTEYLL